MAAGAIAGIAPKLVVGRRLVRRFPRRGCCPSAEVAGRAAGVGLYVPGKVAMAAARSVLAAREGVLLRIATLSALYDIALNLLGAALVVPLWLAVSEAPIPAQYRWVSVGVALLGLALLHPALVSRAVRLGGWLLRRPLRVEGLSYAQIARLVLGYVLVWGIYGAALWLFVRAFRDVPLLYVADCTGMLALSLCAGFLALIVPAGLGVREGVLAGVLSLTMPLPLAVAIALALRVFVTLGQACGLGFVFLLSCLLSRRSHARVPAAASAQPRRGTP